MLRHSIHQVQNENIPNVNEAYYTHGRVHFISDPLNKVGKPHVKFLYLYCRPFVASLGNNPPVA